MNNTVKKLSILLAAFMLISVAGCAKEPTTEIISYYESVPEGVSDSQGSSSDIESTDSADSNVGSSKQQQTGGSSQNKPSDREEKKLKGKLELQAFSNGSDDAKGIESVVESFEKANPDLDVTLRIGVNVHSQLLTRWMSGNPTDFVWLNGAGFPTDTIEASGGFYDLSSWIKTAKVYGSDELIKDRLQDDVLVYNGKKLNKMPISSGAYGLWYDANYFSQNNLSAPQNYEDLKAFTAVAKSKGKSSLCYPGVYSGYLVMGMVVPAIAAYGDQEWFDKVTGATDPAAFTDKRMKEILTRLYDLAKDGAFMKGTVQLNHIESQMEWLNRKSLLIPNGIWLENEMADDTPANFRMKFAATSLATKSQGNHIVMYTGTVAVADKGKNRDNALEFLRFLYTDESQKVMCETEGSIPAIKTDRSSYKYSDIAKETIDYITGSSVKRVTLKNSWGTVDAEFNNVVNSIVLGEITPDKACERLAAACKTKIAESK